MGPWGRLVETISSRLAFFPPSPPTYQLLTHQDGTGELYIQPDLPQLQKVLGCDVFMVKVPRGEAHEIVAARIPYRPPGGVQNKRILTMLYSHGNAVDMGQLMPFFKELSSRLGCHVMGYDYSGYGCSSGTPSVRNTLANVKACFQVLKEKYNTPAKDIILYGQSVGSGPTVYLGSEEPQLAGVVLHAPLMSGIRVLYPNLKWWPSWADVYRNYQLMPKVKAPVLIMHGMKDDLIDVSHGKMLHSLAQNPVEPLYPENSNHQNLEACPEYFPTLQKFVKAMATKSS
ncbi:unnamed protein product [Ostreobium quekettii]|uniref:Serine aminopeptidase S33 domain-containing protein n=1 Tax=Ostreobium quekettii TaxID=121088 RepID=A0A8S1IM09_9CHLO|nr:unnamed protein product [Ostreobium quekettii]